MEVLTFEQWYRVKQQEALNMLEAMKEEPNLFFHFAEEYSLVSNELRRPKLSYMFYLWMARARKRATKLKNGEKT